MKPKINNNDLAIYQAKSGALELKSDISNDTLWANLNQIAKLFDRDKSVISRHIKNIFTSGELEKKSTVAIFATVQKEGARAISRDIEHFNLDIILSVGYRVNSKAATKFRQWATQTLKQHITKGYTINEKTIKHNKKQFLKTLDDLKILAINSELIETQDILSLIESFSATFFTLESYDKNNFPNKGNELEIKASAKDLNRDIQTLKQELIKKGEASTLFAKEHTQGSLDGIFGAVFQSVFGQDAYPSIEEKAAHLLYFIIKNHPFNDGNKRCGAFSFVWLLQKAEYSFIKTITPETLSTLTLLVAISSPDEKSKMIGLILLLLNSTN